MPQCKWCEKKGFFLIVDKQGICRECVGKIILDVEGRMRILTESAEMVKKSSNIKTQLSRLDLMRDHLMALEEYEAKGITVMDEKPSRLLEDLEGDKDKIIAEHIRWESENAFSKAEFAGTLKSKLNPINKVLVKINEFKCQLSDMNTLDKFERKLRAFSHSAQLDQHLEAAKKHEFKGNLKKALDQYQEALYFLKIDKIDDEMQREEISKITSDIERIRTLLSNK